MAGLLIWENRGAEKAGQKYRHGKNGEWAGKKGLVACEQAAGHYAFLAETYA